MPRRGGGPGGARFLQVRVALFWVAVIIWLTGLLLDLQALTGLAIVILVGAMVLGLLARRGDLKADQQDAEGEKDRYP